MTVVKRKLVKPVAKKSPSPLAISKLQVFDIPVERLHGDDLNPNEMSEDKFDALCEAIRENGFDEPIIVIPHPALPDNYLIASGHHRTKAGRKAGMTVIPAIIKPEWDEDKQKFALVQRNIMRGEISTQKFTKLYNELATRYDPKLLQAMMGLTDKKEFERMYEQAAAALPPKQRQQLAKAKEKIKSVDDLSSVLNTIFKEAGSDIEEGYAVFSFNGKEHHYIAIDAETNAKLKSLKKDADAANIPMKTLLASIIAAAGVGTIQAQPAKRRRRRRA